MFRPRTVGMHFLTQIKTELGRLGVLIVNTVPQRPGMHIRSDARS